jgi:opacity protein-like surface antigen
MKKMVIIAMIVLGVAALSFSSEAVQPETNKGISFTGVFSNGMPSPLADKITEMETETTTYMAGASFKSWLKKYNKTFFKLAIAMTIATAAGLVVGITGSVIIAVVSAQYATTALNWSAYLSGLYAGQALAGLGWSVFSLCLPAMIVFWIFYALGRSGKSSLLKEVPVENGIGFAIKL